MVIHVQLCGELQASSRNGTGIGSKIIYDYVSFSKGLVDNIYIKGGSVKVNSVGFIQLDKNGGSNVYLCKIENPNVEGVVIDEEVYKTYNHTAIDATGANLYMYLTGENHIVQIGRCRYTYTFEDWYNGNTKYVFDDTLDNDIMLEVKWRSIVFDTMGGDLKRIFRFNMMIKFLNVFKMQLVKMDMSLLVGNVEM